MEVFVVVSNNSNEVNGEIDGVYKKYEDAKAKFDEMVAQWKAWAEGDDIEEDDTEKDYYCMTNHDQGEFMEIAIKKEELQ